MKKVLLLLLSVAAIAGAGAQVGSSFQTNLFLNGKGGVVLYNNDNGMALGFGGGAALGKWVAEPLALRFGVDVASVADRQQTANGGSTLHLFASIDAMWDLWTVFGDGPQDWYIRAYPFVGIGGMFRTSDDDNNHIDNTFQVSFGVHAPFSLNRYSNWAGFLEYRLFLLPDHYDNNSGGVSMHNVSVGFTRRFNVDPYHRRTATESHTMRDDWFVGFGIGPNYSSFEALTNPNAGGLAMIGVAPEIMVGKNYSNFWTLRLELTGLSAHEPYDTLTQSADRYMFTFLHGDLMINLSHALYFKRGVKWNVLPYVGVGPVWRYDDKKMNMAGNAGIMFRRYINEAGDFFVDAKYVMVPPSVGGGCGPSGSIYGVGIPSITVGYIYNFGVTSTRYRLPASHSIECVY